MTNMTITATVKTTTTNYNATATSALICQNTVDYDGVEENTFQKNENQRNALPPKNFRTFINFTAGF